MTNPQFELTNIDCFFTNTPQNISVMWQKKIIYPIIESRHVTPGNNLCLLINLFDLEDDLYWTTIKQDLHLWTGCRMFYSEHIQCNPGNPGSFIFESLRISSSQHVETNWKSIIKPRLKKIKALPGFWLHWTSELEKLEPVGTSWLMQSCDLRKQLRTANSIITLQENSRRWILKALRHMTGAVAANVISLP